VSFIAHTYTEKHKRRICHKVNIRLTFYTLPRYWPQEKKLSFYCGQESYDKGETHGPRSTGWHERNPLCTLPGWSWPFCFWHPCPRRRKQAPHFACSTASPPISPIPRSRILRSIWPCALSLCR